MKSFVILSIAIIFLSLLPSPTIASNNDLWAKVYSYTEPRLSRNSDFSAKVIQTEDNGYLIPFCISSSFTWYEGIVGLLKTDSEGRVQWEKEYYPTNLLTEARLMDGIETPNGDFVFTGYSFDNLGDAILVKFDHNGELLWIKTYGDSQTVVDSILLTSDNGYLLGGSIYANKTAVMLKFDIDGTLLWQRNYGDFVIYQGIPTLDTGYAFVGEKGVFPFLLKTDNLGNEEYNQTYSQIPNTFTISVTQTVDGGFFLAGKTTTNYWLVKTDGHGVFDWNITLVAGKEGSFPPPNIESQGDGVVILYIVDNNGYGGNELSGNFGFWNDIKLAKFDMSGNPVWNSTFETAYTETPRSLIATNDGGLVILGQIKYDEYYANLLLVKTDEYGTSSKIPVPKSESIFQKYIMQFSLIPLIICMFLFVRYRKNKAKELI